MAENNKMFVNFTGSKSDFKAKGYETTYANKIVFISGALSSVSNYKDLSAEDKVPCIFTRGRYHDVKQYMDLIPYVKGVKVGDTDYNVANGGGYLALAANDPATLNINTTNTGVVIGLTDAAKNAINGAVQSVLPAKNAIVTAEKNGTAVTLSVNTATDLSNLNKSTENISVPTAKAARDYTDGIKTAVIGAPSDSSTADTIYGAKAYTDAAKNAVVGASSDNKDANTVYGAKAYADAAVAAVTGGDLSDLKDRIDVIEDEYATKEYADDAVSNVIKELNANLNDGSAAEHVSVNIKQTNGKIHDLVVTTSDIASAAALGDVSTLTTDADTVVDAINEVKTGAAVTIDNNTNELIYTVKQGGVKVADINIPKEMFVESGKVVVDPAGQEKGTYLELTIKELKNPIYIDVKKLVDVYTAQNDATSGTVDVTIDGYKVSAAIKAGSVGKSQLAANINNVIAGTQTTANANAAALTGFSSSNTVKSVTDDLRSDLGTKPTNSSDVFTRLAALDTAVGAGGSVSTQITNAINELDSNATSNDGTNVEVKVTQTDGKITAVNITKDDTLTKVEGSTYVSASGKESAKQTISVTVKPVLGDGVATAAGQGLADAYAVNQALGETYTDAVEDAGLYTRKQIEAAFTWEELS